MSVPPVEAERFDEARYLPFHRPLTRHEILQVFLTDDLRCWNTFLLRTREMLRICLAHRSETDLLESTTFTKDAFKLLKDKNADVKVLFWDYLDRLGLGSVAAKGSSSLVRQALEVVERYQYRLFEAETDLRARYGPLAPLCEPALMEDARNSGGHGTAFDWLGRIAAMLDAELSEQRREICTVLASALDRGPEELSASLERVKPELISALERRSYSPWEAVSIWLADELASMREATTALSEV